MERITRIEHKNVVQKFRDVISNSWYLMLTSAQLFLKLEKEKKSKIN